MLSYPCTHGANLEQCTVALLRALQNEYYHTFKLLVGVVIVVVSLAQVLSYVWSSMNRPTRLKRAKNLPHQSVESISYQCHEMLVASSG